MVSPFSLEPSIDFQQKENVEAFNCVLGKVKEELGKEYPLVIGGEKIETKEKLISINPANHNEIVGKVSKATQDHAQKAIECAKKAFEGWSALSGKARANHLLRMAAIMRKRRSELAAWIIYEVGKPWNEADGEVVEAIDFIEYYARQMIKFDSGVQVESRSFENNELTYIPLGVGVTISPWNFPLSILVGTTVGPVVAGNTVVLKPASLTPVVAYKFMEILDEAGLPQGVVNYVPGSGSEVGDFLVEHPDIHFINFTGSKEVGISIYEKAAKVQPGQQFLKKTAIEMGGKDTIIVDKNADIDLAVESIVQSAYGLSGQKCASCSRVVAHESVYDEMLSKVIERTKELTLGVPKGPDIYMGPVIDEKAFDKIMNYIEIGKKEAKLVIGGNGDKSEGYFIEPTIFADADPECVIMQEEIFGPVLGFTKGSNIDELIQIANNTEYALTGSIISNDRNNIEKARRKFHVGNLYINRGCTSAVVGHHPFGGFKLSGTNTKVGGPNYILNFMNPKTLCEQFQVN